MEELEVIAVDSVRSNLERLGELAPDLPAPVVDFAAYLASLLEGTFNARGYVFQFFRSLDDTRPGSIVSNSGVPASVFGNQDRIAEAFTRVTEAVCTESFAASAKKLYLH